MRVEEFPQALSEVEYIDFRYLRQWKRRGEAGWRVYGTSRERHCVCKILTSGRADLARIREYN